MRVQKLRISNVLGIEELEIEPGSVTVAEGKNGVGKTSLIEALRSVIGGGHDGSLVRNGADVGEIVLILDDGTEIRKRITRERSSVSVKNGEGFEVKGPQSFITKLADALSFDPAAFLRADPKRQVELFLEALPIELREDDVFEAIGDVIEVPDSALRGHPLDVLSGLHKRVYDERTGLNRAAKEKKATVTQLSASLPEDEGGVANEAGPARQRKDQAQERLRHAVSAIETAREKALADLREETQQKIDEIKAAATAQAETIRSEAQAAIDAAEEKVHPELERLTAEIAAGEEREKQQAAAENTRKVLATLQTDVNQLTAQSEALTAALGRLDVLKTSLLKQVPIKGVEVIDGLLHKDGVPWPRVNKAEQVKVAIRLAQLRAGDLKLVCVDELECLDGKTFESFRKHAAKTDLQFVVTRVSPEQDGADGLRITTDAGELAGVGG